MLIRAWLRPFQILYGRHSRIRNTRMTPQREDNYQVAEVSNVTAAPNVSQQNAVNKIVINALDELLTIDDTRTITPNSNFVGGNCNLFGRMYNHRSRLLLSARWFRGNRRWYRWIAFKLEIHVKILFYCAQIQCVFFSGFVWLIFHFFICFKFNEFSIESLFNWKRNNVSLRYGEFFLFQVKYGNLILKLKEMEHMFDFPSTIKITYCTTSELIICFLF